MFYIMEEVWKSGSKYRKNAKMQEISHTFVQDCAEYMQSTFKKEMYELEGRGHFSNE